jgi:hypothetical protein
MKKHTKERHADPGTLKLAAVAEKATLKISRRPYHNYALS